MSVAFRTSGAASVHTDYYWAGEEEVLALVGEEAPGQRLRIWGSAVSGQGGHTGQGGQQACVYVNPLEEHSFMQPLVMVV